MLTRSVAFGAAALLALGACSAEVSTGSNTIDEAQLESTVAAELAAQNDMPEPNIDCPGDLEAEVDATTTCVLAGTDGGSTTFDVSVTVTSVDEDTNRAEFDIEVARTPNEPDADSEE